MNELNEKKQLIERELSNKEQELSNKEQELSNNIRETNDLKFQKKLLNERSNDLEKTNKLVNKKNDELRDEIKKLKEAKIQRLNIINKDLSTLPNVIQDARKRDDKARTFATPDQSIELTEDDWEKFYESKRSTDLLKSKRFTEDV